MQVPDLCISLQAVNKLAEIMNRKEYSSKKSGKNNAADQALKKKEKEMRKLQQDLHMVSLYHTNINI